MTIEADVQAKSDVDCDAQVDGELHAVGTSQNNIVFTSNGATPQAGDWKAIIFYGYQ